jgi:hypothetical protein
MLFSKSSSRATCFGLAFFFLGHIEYLCFLYFAEFVAQFVFLADFFAQSLSNTRSFGSELLTYSKNKFLLLLLKLLILLKQIVC